MEFTFLDQLSLQQQHCKIKTRLARLWESTIPQLKNQILSLECLLIDEKGNLMQATIRKQDVEHFKQILSEGIIYVIENFNVIPTRNKYKVVDHKYMIQISKWTNVVETKEDVESIPLHSFNFISFDHIESKRHNDGCLLDVLGSIAAISPVSYTYVGQDLTPLRNLEIQDPENSTLSVTLWDKFALDFNDRLIHENEATDPIVVIFASMSVRIYKEKLQLSTCSASRFYINLEIPEVAIFRDALRRRQLPIGPIQHIEVAEQTSLTPYEQMTVNRKTIYELLKLNPTESQNTKYTCKAKLVDIDTTYGWWYKACYNCKGGVKDYDDAFWCGQCGKNDRPPMPWYKLHAFVEDETGSANFMIFGKLAQDLIQVPIQQLATATSSNRFLLPPAMKNILGETYIFQISIDSQRFNMNMQSFRVTKIFQTNMVMQIKTEKKEQVTSDGGEGNVQTSSKASQNELVEKTSTSKITETISQAGSEKRTKQTNTRKRSLRYIETSELDKEEK